MLVGINVPGDVAPLTISYQMTYERRVSDLSDRYPNIPKWQVPGHKIGYTIRPREEWEEESLWITGTEIEFTAHVHNVGVPGQLDGWQAGFIQTIYRLERNGHYQNGVVRRLRLNTTFGPLTDGQAPPFYSDPEKFGPLRDSVHFNATDAPNFKLPLEYGPQHSLLLGTSGVEVFRTFLVLAREWDKSIVTLARLDWRIIWGGMYEHKNAEPWRPHKAGEFFRVLLFDTNPKLYARLARNHMNVPFSLKMTEAEKFCQIWQDGKWMRCSMGGDVKDPEVATLDTWRTRLSSM
jgi:hypothetical protein